MRLLLHIGTEKTGTTAAQVWFRENREALKRQGVLYPLSLGETDHRKLSVCARDPLMPDDGFQRYGIAAPAEHAAFVEETRAAFEEELRALGPRSIETVIVSSEHLHSRAFTETMVSSVRDFFGSSFAAIEVVVYLRPQVDLAASYLGTVVRNGGRATAAWFDQVTPENSYYNYDALIGRWERCFGESNVRVLPYDREATLVDHACGGSGWNMAELSDIARRNVAPTIQLMALMNAANDGGARRIPNAVRERINAYAREVAGQPVRLGRDLAGAIQARFAESNARLAARRPDLAGAALTADLARYDRESNVATLDHVSPFAAPLRAVLESYELALARESARAHLAEADLLLAGGDVAQAESKARAARRLLASDVPGAEDALGRLRERAEALVARCARRAVPASSGARTSRRADLGRRRVAVLDVRMPFAGGAAGLLGDGLVDAINRLVPDTRAELVQLPFRPQPDHAVLDAMMTGRLADMTESGGRRIDLVVALGFPASLAASERRVCWLSHEHLALYEPGRLLPGLGRDDVLRDRVHRLDGAALRSALGRFSTCETVARGLARDAGIESEVVPPPPPYAGRLVAGPYGGEIVCVGRDEPADRLVLLLEALVRVPGPRARILAAGRDAGMLRGRAAALGVADRTEITAAASGPELLRALAAARAVLAGPGRDDHGISAVEALQAAKPVITFGDAHEVRRIVQRTGGGWVCEPTAAALAGALAEAWDATPAALHDRVRAGRAVALGISWENVVSRVVAPFL